MTDGFAAWFMQLLAVRTSLGQCVAVLGRAPRAAPVPAGGHRPELWDDHAAERIVAVIAGWATRRS